MKEIICKLLGHKWEEVEIKKETRFPYSICYMHRLKCRRCGRIVASTDKRAADHAPAWPTVGHIKEGRLRK